MRRLVLNLGVSAAALAAAGFAFYQRQTGLAVCFILLAALRAAATLISAKPRKPDPPIKLNLDGDAPQ